MTTRAAIRDAWVWGVVTVLALGVGARLIALSAPQPPAPAVEDRRQHHFRTFTYSQTERLVTGLLHQAYQARTPRERALALARVAAVQRERGLDEAATAAAREALQQSGGDPAIRTILSNPLRLEDITPRP
jgi:DNA-binding phage protein